MSSAYDIMKTRCPAIVKPAEGQDSDTNYSSADNSKANSKGDKGQPCLIPREVKKG